MKKWIFVALVLISVCASPALLRAQEKKGDKAVVNQVSAADKAKQDKDVLIANINGLSNQEFRVAILQQIVNEELAKLRNLEAVFADQYKLDVEKFRKGLYRFDDKLGKIIEQPAPVEKK